MTMLYELELESELYEHEYEVAPPLKIRLVRIPYRFREAEVDLESPSPPPRGAVLLTRFGFGKATLIPAHLPIIKRLAATILARMPASPLQCVFVNIVGHEDEVGDPARFG